MKQTSCLILLILALTGLLLGCSNANLPKNTAETYKSYKEIPGVTQAEVDAIEELVARNQVFTFGFPPSTEAFYDEGKGFGGFSLLLYDRMSELLGLEFSPRECDWDELLQDRKSVV